MEYNSDYNNDNSIVNDTIFEDARDTLDFDEYAISTAHFDVKQVYKGVISLLFIIGVVFNALCIRAFGRDQSMKDTTRFLLQMLTAAELTFIVLLFVSQGFGWLSIYLQHYTHLASWIAITSILWLVVLVTFHRYTVLYRPQVATKYSTLPRVKIAVCTVWIASAVFTLPQFFEFGIDGEFLRPMLHSKVYVIGYNMCLKFSLVRLLPLSLNAFFIYCLFLHSRRTGTADRRDDNSSSIINTDDDRQLTTALSIFVAVFDVFQIVQIAEELFHFTLWFDRSLAIKLYTQCRYLYMIFDCLLFINMSVKFVIFWGTSTNFRRTVSDVCRCCRCRRPMTVSERIDGVFSPTDVSFHEDTVVLPRDLPLIVIE